MEDWLSRTIGIAPTTAARIIGTAAVLVIIVVLRWLIVRAAFNRLTDPEHQYRAPPGSSSSAGAT